MANKYYWLRLKKDFFKRHDIRIIEDMPNGKDYILFYLKLMVESLDHEGELRFSDTIPYNEQMLSTITNTNIDIVRSAMKAFMELELIEVLDDNTIYMREVEKLIGAETEWAEKKRQYRIAKEDNLRTKKDNVRQEIEKEIEIDKDIKHIYGVNQNIKLTDEEHKKLCNEFGSEETQKAIDFLSDYIPRKGYKCKSHYLTLRKWVFDAVKEEASKEKPKSKANNFEQRSDDLDQRTLSKLREELGI